MFDAAVASAQAQRCIAAYLPPMLIAREGFVLQAEADEIIRAATASAIGTWTPQPIP